MMLLLAAPCVVCEFVWSMQLVKSAQSHGIVEGWVVVEVVEVVVVVHLVVVLTQMTDALRATNVVIIHTTALVLVVEPATATVARGTVVCCNTLCSIIYCSMIFHC